MEIGSFIELQFEKGKEFYNETICGNDNIARLNSGRAAIYHAIRLLGCSTVWIPYYQCETVREFLTRKGVTIKYYHISNVFEPVDIDQREGEAVLLVNYYGILSQNIMNTRIRSYKNCIVDNSQSFFMEPIEGVYNVYSARKFLGVPDGAYVIGSNANRLLSDYSQCYSSDTSLFLLQRIEYGCEGKTYASRTVNEERIDSEDIMRMSKLTRTILDGIEYQTIIDKRQNNFNFARELFDDMNCFDLDKVIDNFVVPMVYPLVVEDESLLATLLAKKHFQGRWWHYLTEEMTKNSFEYYLSKYMIPITIDQRYGKNELSFIHSIVSKHMKD